MRSVRVAAFDTYGTLFDAYCVTARAEQLFVDKGKALSVLWHDEQTDYTCIHLLAGPLGKYYKPFWDVTADALRYATACLGVELSAHNEATLMREYARLSASPENVPTPRRLREMGLPLGILSSGNPQMLDIVVKNAGVSGLFDYALSVDAVELYKIAPQAYALAP